MTALYIIAGVLLLFALILLSPVVIRVSACKSGSFTAKASVLFLTFTLYDSVQKEKPEKKKSGKPKKAKKEKEKKKDESEAERPIRQAYEIIRELVGKLGNSLSLRFAKVRVLVGSDDPAKTGVLYGAVSAAAGSLYGLLCSLKRRSHKKNAIEITVTPDFLATEFDYDIDIALEASVWNVLSIAVTSGRGLMKLKGMTDGKKDDKNKE